MSSSYPTPSLAHLTADDYNHVYEPAEDSFLLMDALEADADLLKSERPYMCLEVGVGAGAVITLLSSILGPDAVYLGTDINPLAAKAATATGMNNGTALNVVVTDLVNALLPRCGGLVDVLLFNPPYVVTPSEEVGKGDLTSSWAGGAMGREVTDRFLPIACQLLSPKGRFYLLLLEENKPGDVAQKLAKGGLTGHEVIRRRAGREHLSVWCFKRCGV